MQCKTNCFSMVIIILLWMMNEKVFGCIITIIFLSIFYFLKIIFNINTLK